MILKLVSIRDLLIEISFLPKCLMRLYCDNMTVINIVEMPCFMREPNTFFQFSYLDFVLWIGIRIAITSQKVCSIFFVKHFQLRAICHSLCFGLSIATGPFLSRSRASAGSGAGSEFVKGYNNWGGSTPRETPGDPHVE